VAYLGQVETGNTVTIKATFIAPFDIPGAESTAITVTVVDPDGTVESPVSSPNATITGPTYTTLDDGRHQTVWLFTHAAPTIPGRWTVRVRSTAGLTASENSWFDVPAYVPLATP
jgi:hypothetical protein